jgi:hypothetical protein
MTSIIRKLTLAILIGGSALALGGCVYYPGYGYGYGGYPAYAPGYATGSVVIGGGGYYRGGGWGGGGWGGDDRGGWGGRH